MPPAFGKSFMISFLEDEEGPAFAKPFLDALPRCGGFDFMVVLIMPFFAVAISETCFGVCIYEEW